MYGAIAFPPSCLRVEASQRKEKERAARRVAVFLSCSAGLNLKPTLANVARCNGKERKIVRKELPTCQRLIKVGQEY